MTWRQGTRVPIHLYDQHGPEPDTRPWPDGDRPVAIFRDRADAARAVGMEAVLRELVEWWDHGDSGRIDLVAYDALRARARAVAYPEETTRD